MRASPQETDGAAQATIGCLKRAAHDLDDQISDPTSVAYGMVGACDSEIRNSIDATSQGLSLDGRRAVKSRLDAFFLKSATTVILQERSARLR